MNGPGALRSRVSSADRQAVAAIVASTGFFSPDEQAIAVELIDEYLARGEASGYRFVFADHSQRGSAPGETCPQPEGAGAVGYACYGPVPGTRGSFDLYWIAVHADHRHSGIGARLLNAVVDAVARAGGSRLYAETSSRDQYAPTRSFYLRQGFVLEARLRGFYAPGDDKLVYVRALAGEPAATG